MKQMGTHPIQLLLVEDNLGDARLLQELLLEVSTAKFELTHVEHLHRGIEYLKATSCDVILLDLSLPDSQGLSTLNKIQVWAAQVPIVVLTGLNDELLAIRALQNGAQDYLIKGQVSGDLLARSIRYAIERKRVEEVLRRTAAENLRLAQAVIAASDGIIITDPNQDDNPIIYANPAFSRITGYSAQEVCGRNCRFLQGPETDPKTVLQIRQAIAQQREIKTTLLNYRKDGQLFWNELKISPVFSEQKVLLYFVGTQTDVTERRQSEQKIREQAALLDIAADAILVQNLDNSITYWNKGAARLYGWSAEEAIGQLTSQILYAQVPHQLLEVPQILFAEGEWQGELNQVNRAGQKIIVESRWTLVRDEDGTPKSILIVSTDITEKKQLEAQFLRAQRLESLGTLAGGIAHDLNNMLSPILMAAQLLRRKSIDDQGKQWLSTIETSARRGADLVKQVLSFARGLEGDRINLQIGHLIREVEKIVREIFPKSIEVHTDVFTQKIWPLLGDPTQLHQVIMNLCVNARDAMPDGGILTIKAENLLIDEGYARMNIDAHVGPYVLITVTDTGMGIPPETLDRIFEPFFTTKEVGKGTGLGLSTVIGILRDHGGFIKVYSEVGKGTTFRVYLPALAPEAERQIQEQAQLFPKGNQELILVVDDEAPICEITKNSLEAYEYRVLTARDGVEAIALYVQHRQEIALVLVDMMMPVLDGTTTIRTLYKINPQVKVVAMSGLASNQQTTTIANTGVRAFIAKPYTTECLLKTLHDAIHKN